jgi:signal transduction histidine kinase
LSLRPLDRLPSLRRKLAVVIVFAVGLTILLVYVLVGYALSDSTVVQHGHPGMAMRMSRTLAFLRDNWWQLIVAAAAAAGTALLMARLLARGMTTPLREMAHAAGKMARGDYTQRVETHSRDEVGELAEAFNRMSAQLESVERLRRDLVANVSHELKTPISALRAHLENLLDGVEEPDARTLAIMLQQAERLSRLVEQLLDLSRLESGEMPVRLAAFDLGPLATEVIAEVDVARGVGDSRVESAIPDELPRVWGDRERIHQVLFNLVDNGVRFTPAPGRVVVSADLEALAGRCQVRVTDTGAGIPPEHLPLLFERFYRVDPSRSREDGGTGIGLAIARSVVEAHGGTIRAESQVGKGSSFVFDLPLASSRTNVRSGRRDGRALARSEARVGAADTGGDT